MLQPEIVESFLMELIEDDWDLRGLPVKNRSEERCVCFRKKFGKHPQLIAWKWGIIRYSAFVRLTFLAWKTRRLWSTRKHQCPNIYTSIADRNVVAGPRTKNYFMAEDAVPLFITNSSSAMRHPILCLFAAAPSFHHHGNVCRNMPADDLGWLIFAPTWKDSLSLNMVMRRFCGWSTFLKWISAT